ncbi:MAG: hypothetical protein B7Z31_07195, partial [Rhodobacterales bacterium 12-65-15]
MNRSPAVLLAAALGVVASQSQAGGPVVMEDAEEVVVGKPASTEGILPVLIGIVVICAPVCNTGD